VKTQFDSGTTSIDFSITPRIGDNIALPVPSKEQIDSGLNAKDWRGVVELVASEMNKEPGVTCTNAMEMCIACCFSVELQGHETAKQAENRVRKAFIRHWNAIVTSVKKGVKI